ncbi:hypothetical protein D3C84_363850 [compost metagenome]
MALRTVDRATREQRGQAHHQRAVVCAATADQKLLRLALGTAQGLGDADCRQFQQCRLYIRFGIGGMFVQVLVEPVQIEQFATGALRPLGFEEGVIEQCFE